jgi:hypothetical protein
MDEYNLNGAINFAADQQKRKCERNVTACVQGVARQAVARPIAT